MEKELKDKCQTIADKIEKELIDYSYFLKLKMLLYQEYVDKEEVYSLITPLCENFKNIYKPVFYKIKDKNIDSEITQKVTTCLERTN